MKTCSKCEQSLSNIHFGVNLERHDKKQSWCKPCMNSYRRTLYRENRAREIQRSKDRTTMLRSWVRKYKSTLKCERCSETHPATLDFHHVKGVKEFNISHASNRGYSINKIKEEIAKCIVICSNCHRIEHYNKT